MRKIGPIIASVAMVVMIVVLAVLITNDQKKEEAEAAQYEEISEARRPLLVKQQQLERELKELEENYESERTPKGSTQIVFTELDARVYSEIYPIMKRYNFKGILSLSLSEYPGAEGCMSLPQFKELMNAGWTACITWDTETKLDAWWMLMSAKIQELGIAMPTTAYFKTGTYTTGIDDVLKEKGITAVYHHGEELDLIQLSYEEELWHLGAVGLMGEKPKLRMEEAIEAKGNVAFLVGFELEDELYNENSFTSMLNYFDTYRASDELVVGSLADAANHYQTRYSEADGDVSAAFQREKEALETELADIAKQLEELKTGQE